MKIQHILIFLLLLTGLGCVEDYPPPVANEAVDFLVVDGSIDGSTGAVEVKLSRAIPLASDETPPPELNAQLQIEDADGMVYPMSHFGNGVYRNDNITINNNKQYRLSIRRQDGREYFSEYVSMKPTPPIDSVVWRPNQFRDGIQILVNTHDDSNSTRYYQWTFVETYEYTAPFFSFYKYENGEVASRQPSEYTNRCWQTLTSKKIIIGSSGELNSDIISNFIVNEVTNSSQKVVIKYSILVRQRALTKEAYTYWLNLQKTTENLGGLFDPQPGRVNGNISNVNSPGEPVIGYFDIGAIQEKRIFIENRDLPEGMRPWKDMMGCLADSVAVDDVAEVGQVAGLSFVNAIVEGITTVGYTYSTNFCTDCRLQGGTLTKPLFWE